MSSLRPAFTRRIARFRAEFEGGNRKALFDAIAVCAMSGLPLPTWAAHAFTAGYKKVDEYEVGSWDEAFGRPYAKGTKLCARRSEHLLRIDVYDAIRNAMAAGVKTPRVFDVVGAAFRISSSTTRDYYYGIKDAMEPPDTP